MIALRRQICYAAMFMAIAVHCLAARAAEQGAADPAVRAAIRQLRSASALQRAEALRRLRPSPSVEAAKQIVPSRLADSLPEVRQAACETLLAWKDDREVAAFLLTALAKEKTGRRNAALILAPLLTVLLASDVPDVPRELDKSLAAAIKTTPDAIATLIALADELGEQGDKRCAEIAGEAGPAEERRGHVRLSARWSRR